MDSIVIVRLLALSQESPLKTSPEQLERSRLDAIARRVAATASTVANAAVGALDRKSQFVSPTKPLQMNGAAAATVALVISPQQRERMAQNEREAKLRLANKRKRDETSPRAAAVADSGGGGNATATTSKARTLIFTSAAAASAGAGVDDSNKRIKPTPPLSATAASSSSSSSSSSAAAAAARANGNGTAAAARAVVRPLPNGICVLRPDTEWLLSSAHAPRSLLSAAGRDSLSTPSGFILMLIFDQLNIWDDSTTTTILTPVLAAKSASAGAAPVIPPRVLHWSTFETCQLVCKSWNITLTQNARFVWKRRALYILRQCEPMNFDRYHRILQCPPPKITQYDPDDYYEVSRKIAACDRLASELVISLAKYELQRMESTKRVGGGVDDMFCARLGQFRWPPSNPISYVNDVLFAPAFDPAVKKLSSSQSKPAAGLFRGVLYTNMRGQNDEKCDEPTQRRIDRFITEYLSVDDSLLATAHAPYVALPSNCGYQRLGACVALSVLNAGQSRRIVRLFRVVQSEFGITRGWLQEVLCLLLCRIHRLWTLTLSMQQPRPEPTEELARLYRIIRGAAYRFDVYENDVATGVGKFPRPPAAATATAMVAMHDRHSGEGACTCNADELRKSFLRAQKNTRHFGQLQTALAMYLPRFPYHPTIRLSPEQEAVVRSDLLLPTDVLYVPAFAGTGKTTTMLHYALARPHVSFLYVSFNKAMVADVRRTYHEMVTQRYPCMQPIDDPTAAAAATSDTDSDDDLPSSQPSSQSDGKSRSAKVVNRVHNIAFRTLSSIYFAWLKQRHEKEHPPQRIAATPRFSQFSQSGRGRGRGGWGRAAGAAPVTAALDRKPDQSRELRSSDVADLLPALRAELDLRFPGNENRTARTKAYAGVLRTMNQYVQSAEVEWSSITASYFFAKDDPQTNYVKWAKELFAILKTSDRASSIVGKLLQLQSPCATTAISASSSSSTGAAAAAATAATTVRLKAAANGSAAAASIPINAAGTGRDLAVQFSDFIAKSDHYDVLIVDEAQDLNGCDWDLVLRQQVPKLIIGDPHQAIYGFRGAVGIPEPPVFVPTKTLYLRETFRFGAEIATIANSILQLSGERQRLLGSSLPEKRGFICELGVPMSADGSTISAASVAAAAAAGVAMSVLALPPLPDASSSSNSAATTATSTFQLPVVLPPSDQFVGYTILARSRKGLFDAALRETLLGKPIKFNAPKFASTESKTERSFKSTGGLNFELISDAYKLFSKAGLPKLHPWTKYDGITSFNELKAFAEATSDSTLSCIVEVVEERKEQIPDFLKKMKSRIAVGAGLSTERVITLSTIHSAKGMDWTAVRIENDFSVGFNAATGFITKVNKSTEEELNMLYVAVTRAKRLLHPPTLLRELYPTLNVLRPLSAVSTHAASEQTRRLAVECNAKGIPVPANPPPVQLKCRQCEHHALPDAFDMNGPRPNNLPLVCRPSTHPAATKHNASIMTIPLPDTFAGTSTSSSSASSAAAVAAAAAKSASMDDVDILSAPLDQYNPPVVYGSFPAAALPECLCSACGNQSVHIYRLLGPFPDPNTHPAATATAAPTTPPLVHLPPL